MQMSNIKFIGMVFLLMLLNSIVVLGTGVDCPRAISESTDVLVSNWDLLPFKNQKVETQNRVDEVNALNPNAGNWSGPGIAFKCLSYGASTSNDWFNLQYGVPMRNYTSYTNGIQENGTNPRLLEAMYYDQAGFLSYAGIGDYNPTDFYQSLTGSLILA